MKDNIVKRRDMLPISKNSSLINQLVIKIRFKKIIICNYHFLLIMCKYEIKDT